MIDSVLAPKMTPYVVNKMLTKPHIVHFVHVLSVTLHRKAMKSEFYYRLKTMVATVNRSSTPFISFAFNGFRFIPFFRQAIVLPALPNSTGQTPKAPIRGNGKGLSGAYKRTLAMRSRLLKATTGIKEIDIFVQKEHGRMPTVLDIQRHQPRQCESGMVTDYELRYLRTVIYASIVK